MSRNRTILTMVSVLLTGAVAGCSGAPGGGAVAGADESGPVTLQVMGVQRAFTADVVAKFESDHPDITVEFINQQPVFEDGSVQTMLRSGSGADVLDISTGPARIGSLIDAGLLPDIGDVWKEQNLEENSRQYVLDQLNKYSGNQRYEVVNGIDVFQVAYNKRIFEDLGLTVPTTWAEFLNVCKTVREAGQLPIVAGFRDGLQAGWMFGQVVQSVAGYDTMTDVIYNDGKWDQKSMVAAAETLKGWLDSGYLDSGAVSALDSDQSQASFYQGQGAMSFLGNTHLIRAVSKGDADPDHFGLFPLPSPNSGQQPAATAGLGTSWVMNPGTNTPTAAKKWLGWVASQEFARMAVESGGQNSVPQRNLPDEIKMTPLLANAAERVDTAGYNPSVFVAARTKDAWYGAAQTIATGEQSPVQAMKAIQAAKEADSKD